MWKPEQVQLGKGLSLMVTVQEFCDIANFMEPEEVVNIAGRWQVKFQVMKKGGKACTRARSFKSKTYANQFVTLLGQKNATVVSGPTFASEPEHGMPAGLKIVTPDGKVSSAFSEAVQL